MSQILQLGSATISNAKANLQAALTTFVHVSSHQRNTANPIELPSAAINVETLKQSWVRRAPGFHLELDIQADDGLCISLEQLRYLTEVVHNAPVWEQLGLRPSMTSQAEKESIIRLNLAQERHVHSPPRLDAYRICFGIPAADLVPPDMVDVWQLMNVKLSLRVSELKRKAPTFANVTSDKRKKKKGATNEPLVEQGIQWRLEDEDEDDLLLELPEFQSSCGSNMSYESTASDLNYMLPSTPRENGYNSRPLIIQGNPQHDDDDLLLDFQPFDPFLCAEQNTNLRLQHWDPINARQEEGRTKHETILGLVDAAFRLSIHDKPQKLQKGIRIKDPVFNARLSEVVPSLWSPGYAAVSIPRGFRCFCSCESAGSIHSCASDTHNCQCFFGLHLHQRTVRVATVEA